MRIDLTNFPKVPGGMTVSFTEEMPLPPAYAPLNNPVTVEFDGAIWDEMGFYVLKGTLRARLCYPCARCLTPVNYDLNLTGVREIFSVEAGISGDIKLRISDDIWPIRGNTADLLPVVETLLIQNIPYKLLCGESCEMWKAEQTKADLGSEQCCNDNITGGGTDVHLSKR
ncbi:MAG: YceD family protein [Clostridiales bacterium]|nr:YceD family protein [Clostridiales bacterium]